MEYLLKDLRFGVRNLLRAPGFAIPAVLALTLGIGATTAIFSVVDGVVLRPLPYDDPERLVMIWETNREKSLEHEPLSPVNFMDYRALTQVFTGAAAWWRPDVTLRDERLEPVRVTTVEASGNFQSVMGVRPVLGQGFPAKGPFYSRDSIVLVSHRLWRSRFNGDRDIVGKQIRLNDSQYEVVGVMPPGFHFPGDTDLWYRLHWDLTQHSRAAHFMEAVGRLAPGRSVAEAQRELDAVTARLGREFVRTNGGWGARAIELHREVVGFLRPALFVLLGAVGVILNVGPVHLELLGTVERVAATKAELIRDLRPGSTCVVPAGERLLDEYMRDDIQTLTFGPGGDVRLISFRDGRAEIEARGEALALELPYDEPHNLLNTLAAVAAATALDVRPEGSVEVRFSSMRGETVELAGGVTVVNDCYNANPMSMRAALDHLAESPAERRLAVLGTMAELGERSAEFHREIGDHAGEAGVDVLVTVGEEAAVYAEFFQGDAYSVATPEEARALLEELVRPGDRVLVKGSRSVGLERVLA